MKATAQMENGDSAEAVAQATRLHGTTDGRVWAQEFNKVFARLHEGCELDEGWLIGWFANAIETGRAAGRRSLESVRSEALAKEFDTLHRQLTEVRATVDEIESAPESPAKEQPGEQDEYGWVIERGDASRPEYWTGWPDKDSLAWSYDNLEAIRFARRQDATNVLCFYLTGRADARVAEHGWIAPPPQERP